MQDTSCNAKWHRRAAVGHWVWWCVWSDVGWLIVYQDGNYLYPGTYIQMIPQIRWYCLGGGNILIFSFLESRSWWGHDCGKTTTTNTPDWPMGAHQRVPDAVTKAWHGNALEIWAKFPVCWTDNDASVFHTCYVLGRKYKGYYAFDQSGSDCDYKRSRDGEDMASKGLQTS